MRTNIQTVLVAYKCCSDAQHCLCVTLVHWWSGFAVTDKAGTVRVLGGSCKGHLQFLCGYFFHEKKSLSSSEDFDFMQDTEPSSATEQTKKLWQGHHHSFFNLWRTCAAGILFEVILKICCEELFLNWTNITDVCSLWPTGSFQTASCIIFSNNQKPPVFISCSGFHNIIN